MSRMVMILTSRKMEGSYNDLAKLKQKRAILTSRKMEGSYNLYS